MQENLRARVAAKAAIFHGNEILLLHRSLNASDPGSWDLPGGQVAQGESLPEALKREVREETGFDVRIGPVFHAEVFGSFSKRGRIRPTVGVFFLCDAPGRKRLKLDRKEHSEYAWVSRQDLKDYPSVPHIERTVRAAFAEKGPAGEGRPETEARLPSGEARHLHFPVPA
jgi:8-oxo-dGTP pyrophosphatase MutT (NUDIX family)